MEVMNSGDRIAIQNLVSSRVGRKYTCPFRLHYTKNETVVENEDALVSWDLVRHESRHMHPVNFN